MNTAQPQMLLSQFFKEYYQPLRLTGRSPRTSTLYAYSIKCFGKTLGREATLADLSDLVVSKHLQRLDDDGYSKHTMSKERDQLLAIWRLACDQRLVDLRPTLPAIVKPQPAPQAWTREQLSLLFDACRRTRGKMGEHKASDWWFALHCVLWDTGERITAVMLARWEHIDAGGWITFPAENRKGQRKPNRRQLHSDTIEALLSIKGQEEQLVFPTPWGEKSGSMLYYHYGKILKRAGLPHGSKSKFHRMRRSVGTHIKASGGDAQKALMHADAATTEKYLDISIATVEQPIERLFRVLKPGEGIQQLALANRFIERNRDWLNEDEVDFVQKVETTSVDTALALGTTRQRVVRKLNEGMFEPGPTDAPMRRMISTVSAMVGIVSKRREGAGFFRT